MDIPKGIPGEFSKIEEEYLEYKDAMVQDNRIMALCELSDIIGACILYAEKYFPNLNLDRITYEVKHYYHYVGYDFDYTFEKLKKSDNSTHIPLVSFMASAVIATEQITDKKFGRTDLFSMALATIHAFRLGKRV